MFFQHSLVALQFPATFFWSWLQAVLLPSGEAISNLTEKHTCFPGPRTSEKNTHPDGPCACQIVNPPTNNTNVEPLQLAQEIWYFALVQQAIRLDQVIIAYRRNTYVKAYQIPW
ncbi:hypothetical protein PGTUg99_005964 [Puccinia graminis f. sp. tritici]|uniref:Secreted protein n=1 Tax=Puccinia graminis f. sp. tritici TaxID=56615 RepID=A0A5B0SKK4_PUCGR|nr:hypothetical protein PGTUg99_005964 [Puccinia graminis f. sp. tritici]